MGSLAPATREGTSNRMTSARLSGTIQREVSRQQSVFFSHEKSCPGSMVSYQQKTHMAVLATWDICSGNRRRGPTCSSLSLTSTKRSISIKGMFRIPKPVLNEQASRSLAETKERSLLFIHRRKTDREQLVRFRLDIHMKFYRCDFAANLLCAFGACFPRIMLLFGNHGVTRPTREWR